MGQERESGGKDSAVLFRFTQRCLFTDGEREENGCQKVFEDVLGPDAGPHYFKEFGKVPGGARVLVDEEGPDRRAIKLCVVFNDHKATLPKVLLTRDSCQVVTSWIGEGGIKTIEGGPLVKPQNFQETKNLVLQTQSASHIVYFE